MGETAIPEVNVWAFAEGEQRQVDHLAIVGADATLCGCKVNPRGYPTMDTFDPQAGYSCKRCVASVRKRGPFAVVSRISSNFPSRVSSVVGPDALAVLEAAAPKLYEAWAENLRGRLVDALFDLPELRQVPESQVFAFADELLGLGERS